MNASTPVYDPLWPFTVVVGGYPSPAPKTPVNPEIEVVPMKVSEHAKIFHAYIDRMSMKELKDILYHCESCYQEFLHGNENSQKNADVVLHSAILNVFERMLSADKNNIESTIDRIINRKG